MPLHAIRDLLGHANVSQTSTYLSTTTSSLHDAMQKFEARDALQRITTKAGTGRQKRQRSATGRKKRPNESAVGRGSAIM
jgi:hypothetical protein